MSSTIWSVGIEQIEHRLDLLDHPVLAARVEERPPVLAGRLEVVLAARRVGQHAVDVDDDRRGRASSGSGRARSSARGGTRSVRAQSSVGRGGEVAST